MEKIDKYKWNHLTSETSKSNLIRDLEFFVKNAETANNEQNKFYWKGKANGYSQIMHDFLGVDTKQFDNRLDKIL